MKNKVESLRIQKRKNQAELILRLDPKRVDLMKKLGFNDEAVLKESMTRQLPRQAYTGTTSASLVIVLGASILISSRYAEWQNVCSQAQAVVEVNRYLESARTNLLQLSAIKRRTIAELAAGRITLEEATSFCLSLDDGWPRIHAYIHTRFPGSCDSEREARFVISLACKHAHTSAERRSLVDRLNAEFTQLFPNADNQARASFDEEVFSMDAW